MSTRTVQVTIQFSLEERFLALLQTFATVWISDPAKVAAITQAMKDADDRAKAELDKTSGTV